jgi:Rrf2 family protein
VSSYTKDVNLRLTRRGDYAVRAAISLGRGFSDQRYRKIREVASEMSIPLRYTPQILRLLARAGLAEARAGRVGGYRLLRDPRDISLLEIVEASEGPLRTGECTLRGGPCHWEHMCAVHPAWEAANNALRDTLSATSLRDVLDIDTGLASGNARPASRRSKPRRRQERQPSL